MSKIREVKPGVKTITLNDGVEREVRFTLNAMAELEERYGSVQAAFEALDGGSIKAARCVLWAGLIEAQPDITEQQVGSLIDINYMQELMDTLSGALGEDMPESTDEVPGLPNA